MWTWFLLMAMGLVVGAAIVAAVVIARLQKQNLHRKLRLEIANRGNVPARYELRGEDPQGALAFEFSLGDDPLPLSDPAPAEQAAPAAPAAAPAAPATPPAPGGGWILPADSGKLKGGVQTAMEVSGETANILGSLAMLLPRSLRDPLLQASGSLRRGRGAAVQAQHLSKRKGRFKLKGGAAPPAPKAATAPAARSGPRWVQTPSLPPGESLTLNLVIRLVRAVNGPDHAFQIVSRVVEQRETTAAAEGSVQIAQSPLLLRLLPYGLILFIAAGILTLIVWLLGAGLGG